MILKGKKKKVTQAIVRFYINNTGSTYDEFIVRALQVEKADESDYQNWLVGHCVKLLTEHEVTLQDCIANKDVLRASVELNAQESRSEGEFYTPEIWASEGRNYLKKILGDQWGKAVIWDGACGTGNLLRTLEDYPPELVFQSTLDEKDVEVIKEGGTKWNTFQLNFLQKLDLDQIVTPFVDQLPERLQQAIRNNEPLAFYMNPPYLVGKAEATEVGGVMKTQGLSKCALDIYHHFIYRIMMLKQVFNHTNIHIVLIGPTTIYQSSTIEELYSELKTDHIFDDGMAFAINEFSNVKGGTDWTVSLTAWRPKTDEDPYENPIMLPTKLADADGNITVVGERNYKQVENSLHYWALPNEAVNRRSYVLPVASRFDTFSGLGKAWEGVLGYLMSSPHAIRGVRRTAVTTLPNGDNLPITEENFWRCVSSFAGRRCYSNMSNGFDNSQYLSAPNETVEGYQQWLIDALVLFMFDNASCQTSYRDVGYKDYVKGLNLQNSLFPLSYEEVRNLVTDETILSDMATFAETNSFIVKTLETYLPAFSPKAREVYDYSMELIRNSLKGDVRKNTGYKNWLQSWDAGMYQIRKTDGIFTDEQEKTYLRLVRELKEQMSHGVYTFGFMQSSMDKNLGNGVAVI